MSFNLPTLSDFHTDRVGLDLSIPRGRLLMGGLELSVNPWSDTALFVRLEAALPTDIDVLTAWSDIDRLTGFGQYKWLGSNLEWWRADGGAVYSISDALLLMAGLKIDRLSMGVTDPVDRSGVPTNLSIGLTYGSTHRVLTADALGDIRIKTVTPYVGLTFGGQYYRMTLKWSPISWISVKAPFDFILYSLTESPTRTTVEVTSIEYIYRVLKPGGFIQAELELDAYKTDMFDARLWVAYELADTQGGFDTLSSLSIIREVTDSGGTSTSTSFYSDEKCAQGVFRRQSLSFGLSGTVRF